MGRIPRSALTPFEDVNALVSLISEGVRAVLGPKLLGLYLSGSLATGGFQHDVSDVDLVAATAAEIDGREFDRLKAMHEEVARTSEDWGHRVDVAYVSAAALMGGLSDYRYPAIFGHDPLHWERSVSDLILTRHVLWKCGVTLFGPPPSTIVAPVPREDLARVVQEACIGEWRGYIEDIHTCKEQAFWTLLMCRALFTVRQGDVVSKPAAAAWARQTLPEWSAAIQRALSWWQHPELWRSHRMTCEAELPETRRFVSLAVEQIIAAS